jgi:hypothetical protein
LLYSDFVCQETLTKNHHLSQETLTKNLLSKSNPHCYIKAHEVKG